MAITPDTFEKLFRYGNQAEALVWFLFAARYAWKIKQANAGLARWLGFGSLTFLVFGISDWVEIETGGWWKPWWLLVWKGLCVLGIAVFAWKTRGRK